MKYAQQKELAILHKIATRKISTLRFAHCAFCRIAVLFYRFFVFPARSLDYWNAWAYDLYHILCMCGSIPCVFESLSRTRVQFVAWLERAFTSLGFRFSFERQFCCISSGDLPIRTVHRHSSFCNPSRHSQTSRNLITDNLNIFF